MVRTFYQAISYFQSIGKVIFMAIALTIYWTVQTFAISPFTLFVCKVSTTQMKVSKVIVDILFSFILITFIYRAKFSIKPSIRQWLSFRFSKNNIEKSFVPNACFVWISWINCSTNVSFMGITKPKTRARCSKCYWKCSMLFLRNSIQLPMLYLLQSLWVISQQEIMHMDQIIS